MSAIKSVIITLAVISAILLISGCGYQDWGTAELQADEDEVVDGDAVISDGDTDTDGDVEVGGAGSLAEPLEMTGLKFSGTGDITSKLSEITGESAVNPAPPVTNIVDGDVDTELEADIVSETDTAETEIETDGDTELETDGDTDQADIVSETDTTEAETDGDTDLEPEAEESEPVADYGSGPEVVVQLNLKTGDTVLVTWKGDNFDGVLYLLPNNNVSAKAESFTDIAIGVGTKESITYLAEADVTVYLVLDTKAGASGTYNFEITIEPDLGDGTPPEDGMVGAACTVDSDCNTDDCLTSEILGGLLQIEINIVNGYCSTVDMFVETCSDECSEANGGFCMNGGFMGEGYEIVNLCLRPCEVTGDCRVQDDNVCLDPQKWVDNGWLNAATKQEYFGDYSLCIPSEFVDVIEEELSLTAGK